MSNALDYLHLQGCKAFVFYTVRSMDRFFENSKEEIINK